MGKTSCKKGQYYCNTDKKCKPIPDGYKVREDGFLVSEGSNPRIPRKAGQPAKSKKHSDLYTDEDPKGTIHGLGFKNVATAKASVAKIRKSSRSHAHKIQAAIAMEQRARVMGKSAEAAVYRKFINSMKKKTKRMNEEKHGDHEPEMIRSQLKTAGRASKRIEKHSRKKDNFKAWVQSKITKASDYLDTAADYLDSKDMKKEAANPAQQAAIAINMKKKGKKPKDMSEGSLRQWFKGSKSKDGKGGWVNVVTGGTCASDEPGEGTPKCVSSSKRASMTKAERLSAARRKKKADPGQQQKTGAAKPTYVSTDKPKKKMKEEIELTEVKDKKGKGSGTKDACYHKVKSRYSVWPSAYASGALVKCRKVGAANWGNKSEEVEQIDELSNKTLASYTHKAFKDVKYFKKAKKVVGDSPYVDKKIDQRNKGMDLALKKQAKKEEVEINSSVQQAVQALDEVSKKTLGNYIKKASTDLATRSIKHGMSGGTETGGDPDSPKNVEKINKRHSGIMKAADKLAKEDYSANPAQQAAIAIAKKERKQDLKVAQKKKMKEEVVTELNRFEKEKGMDTKTGKPVTKGGTAKNDKAFQFVMKKVGKQRMGANQPKKVRGAKNPNETSPTKQKMTRMKAAKASSRAFETRAKRSGYKTAQDYANVVARYGSEDNMKKGRGLGT